MLYQSVLLRLLTLSVLALGLVACQTTPPPPIAVTYHRDTNSAVDFLTKTLSQQLASAKRPTQSRCLLKNFSVWSLLRFQSPGAHCSKIWRPHLPSLLHPRSLFRWMYRVPARRSGCCSPTTVRRWPLIPWPRASGCAFRSPCWSLLPARC
jgi:hypothetical protein